MMERPLTAYIFERKRVDTGERRERIMAAEKEWRTRKGIEWYKHARKHRSLVTKKIKEEGKVLRVEAKHSEAAETVEEKGTRRRWSRSEKASVRMAGDDECSQLFEERKRQKRAGGRGKEERRAKGGKDGRRKTLLSLLALLALLVLLLVVVVVVIAEGDFGQAFFGRSLALAVVVALFDLKLLRGQNERQWELGKKERRERGNGVKKGNKGRKKAEVDAPYWRPQRPRKQAQRKRRRGRGCSPPA
jgi:hypothetical protein